MPPKRWQLLSQQVRSFVYDVCEICGAEAKDCHEKWRYDDKLLIQTLIGLQALCKACHGVKHFGFSRIQGKGEEALKHFMTVNQMSRKKALAHIEKQFAQWDLRSQKKWQLDISILETFGIDTSTLKVGK